MPAGDVEIVGSFTANGDTPYEVRYYLEDLDGKGYTENKDARENLTGKTDTLATAQEKTFAGFTFDESAEGTKLSGKIAGDGSLVLKLYYARNSYKVTYKYEGTVPTGASALPAEATYKYGAEVKVAADATAPGYTFSGWDKKDFTMPADNVEISGSFTANENTDISNQHTGNIQKVRRLATANSSGENGYSANAYGTMVANSNFNLALPGTKTVRLTVDIQKDKVTIQKQDYDASGKLGDVKNAVL